MEICKHQSEIEMRHLPVIWIYGYVGGRQVKELWALEGAWLIFWSIDRYWRDQYISVKIFYLACKL